MSVRTLTLTIPALSCAQYTGRGQQRRPDLRKPRLRKLIGYYTRGARPDAIRLQEYLDWKAHVQMQARLQRLTLPRATQGQPVRVDVVGHFEGGVHCDPENLRKGIVDALWPAGDRWVYGYHHHPLYDAENPRAVVTITWGGA